MPAKFKIRVTMDDDSTWGYVVLRNGKETDMTDSGYDYEWLARNAAADAIADHMATESAHPV